jgi:hypothetical protein
MALCLFEIGQLVFYTPDLVHPNASASGTYTVVGALPDDNSGHQYRIRSEAEAFDRIAHEHELSLVQARNGAERRSRI